MPDARRCEQLGYKPFYFESIFDQDLYFAGSVERRARELEDMFRASRKCAPSFVPAAATARTIFSKAIDLKKIRAHPKIFVGYSDITTLLTYLTDATGLVTFHGPMVTKDFARADGVDLASWKAAVGGYSQWAIDSGRFRREAAGGGLGGGNSVRWLPLHAGGIAGNAV